ncbi:MBL fold metallo-hydrolase [Patescibacteria group bacterium]|nr:MBL fold metallo-hydrolase [Patescibacteria group bacterium]
MKNKKIVYIVIGVLVVLNVFFWRIAFNKEDDFLEVTFFDVGQGDSAFMETSDGFQILIDGGPDLTILEKLGQEMLPQDRTIDLIVLSHPHDDHLFGLLEVLKRYEVKNILWSGAEEKTGNYQEWLRLIEEEQANIIIAQPNQEIKINGSRTGLDLFVYSSDKENSNLNDSSVVMEVRYKDTSFLFTGDISEKIEKKLDVDIDVLKVAHHGSKTSSSVGFLEKVSPEVAVISVGENTYGHPSPETLQNLDNFGIKTLITKEEGDIKVVSDGNFFKINN